MMEFQEFVDAVFRDVEDVTRHFIVDGKSILFSTV